MYNRYISRWLRGEETGNRKGNMSIANAVRRWLVERDGEKCSMCGWMERNPISGSVPIQVHHKDGDSGNTTPNNVHLICPNCHSLTPTYGGLNRGNGRTYRYRRNSDNGSTSAR